MEYINCFDSVIEAEYYVDKVIYSSDKYFIHFNYLDGSGYKDAFCTFDMDFNLLNLMKTDDRVIVWSVNSDSKIIAVEQDIRYRSVKANYAREYHHIFLESSITC